MEVDFAKLRVRMDKLEQEIRFSEGMPRPPELNAGLNEIIAICEQHARESTPNKIGKYNICIVHPYYLELNPNVLREMFYRRKGNPGSVKNLEKLLRVVDRSKYNAVLFEGYRDYILKSHGLVDDCLIDKVIFTHDNASTPHHWEEIEGFDKSKENYIAGAIAHKCVKGAMARIRRYAPFFSIRPIRDSITHCEYRFWLKVASHLVPFSFMNSPEPLRVQFNEISFHIPSKIYYLLKGVESKKLMYSNQ